MRFLILKSYVAQHQRRLKSGEMITVDAHYNKRTKKHALHAPAHSHNIEHLSDEDKDKFNRMHSEQHQAHYYESHALGRKLGADNQLLANLEHSAKRHEEAGDKKSMTAVHNKIIKLKQSIMRHEKLHHRTKAVVEGIGKFKDTLVAGSGELKDDADKMHSHYVSKIGERFKEHKTPIGAVKAHELKAKETNQDNEKLKSRREMLVDMVKTRKELGQDYAKLQDSINEIDVKIGKKTDDKKGAVKDDKKQDTAGWSNPAKKAKLLREEFENNKIDFLTNKSALAAFKRKIRLTAKSIPENDDRAVMIMDNTITKVYGTDYNPKVSKIEFGQSVNHSDKINTQAKDPNPDINTEKTTYERAEKFKGVQAGIEAARNTLASISLGKKFGQTLDDHLKENPGIKKMYDKAKDYIEEKMQYKDTKPTADKAEPQKKELAQDTKPVAKEKVPQRIITDHGKKRKVDDIEKQISDAKEKERTEKSAGEIASDLKYERDFKVTQAAINDFVEKHKGKQFAQALINNDHEKAVDDIYRGYIKKDDANAIFNDAKKAGLLNELTERKVSAELSGENDDKSPKEGEINAEGLVFRDGRWHRDGEDKKEPWQMNKEEWNKKRDALRPETFGSASKPSAKAETAKVIELEKHLGGALVDAKKKLNDAKNGLIKLSKDELDDVIDIINTPVSHRQVIDAAIKNGDKVPQNVLNDYPDLKQSKKQAKTDDLDTNSPKKEPRILLSIKKKETKSSNSLTKENKENTILPEVKENQPEGKEMKTETQDLLDKLYDQEKNGKLVTKKEFSKEQFKEFVTEQILSSMGGNKWEKDGVKRIYFNEENIFYDYDSKSLFPIIKGVNANYSRIDTNLHAGIKAYIK